MMIPNKLIIRLSFESDEFSESISSSITSLAVKLSTGEFWIGLIRFELYFVKLAKSRCEILVSFVMLLYYFDVAIFLME